MTVYIVTSLHGDIMAVFDGREKAVAYQDGKLDNENVDTILYTHAVR